MIFFRDLLDTGNEKKVVTANNLVRKNVCKIKYMNMWVQVYKSTVLCNTTSPNVCRVVSFRTSLVNTSSIHIRHNIFILYVLCRVCYVSACGIMPTSTCPMSSFSASWLEIWIGLNMNPK